MQHHTPLIATLVVGIVLALGFGMAAHRPRASPLVGYLLAGIAVGPFSPGFVADQPLADGLADVGVNFCCSRSACTSRPGTSWRSGPSRCRARSPRSR